MRPLLTIIFFITLLSTSNGQSHFSLIGKFCSKTEDFIFVRCYTFELLNFQYEYVDDISSIKKTGSYSITKFQGDSGEIAFHFTKELPTNYSVLAVKKEKQINEYQKFKLKEINHQSFLMKTKEDNDYVLFMRDTLEKR